MILENSGGLGSSGRGRGRGGKYELSLFSDLDGTVSAGQANGSVSRAPGGGEEGDFLRQRSSVSITARLLLSRLASSSWRDRRC
jgi:hypothetical protein